jgi:GNAT superfamily N-acetyltransferase
MKRLSKAACLIQPDEAEGFELTPAALNMLFPPRWSGVLSREEAEWLIACDPLDVSATRGSFGPRNWSVKRFGEFVLANRKTPEAANVGEGDRLLMLYPQRGTQRFGGLVFDLKVRTTATAVIQQIWISMHLAWVLPEHRGRGHGAMLVAHLAQYFRSHPPTAPFVIAERGVDVIIVADWTSQAGERLTRMLHNYFTAEQEAFRDLGLMEPSWPIARVEIDAGY